MREFTTPYCTYIAHSRPLKTESVGLCRVVRDKIGDVSIKLQFGSDEAWTRALRHV